MKAKRGTAKEKRGTAAQQKGTVEYWVDRVQQRYANDNLQIRLKLKGTQHWFDLGTRNRRTAAGRAKQIWDLWVASNDVDIVLKKYKPESLGKAPRKITSKDSDGIIRTVGEFVDAVLETNPEVGAKSLHNYAWAFRRLALDLSGKEESAAWAKKRTDYKSGGNQEWTNWVGKIRLSVFDPDAIEDWRRDRKATTAASVIRCAKAFANLVNRPGTACREIRARIDSVPLEGVKVRTPAPTPHESIWCASGEELADKAIKELRGVYAHNWIAFCLCFWCGLRKEEADALLWQNVDLDEGTILVTPTKWGRVKSKASRRTVDVNPFVLDELRLHRAANPGEQFVLCGEEDTEPLTIDEHYHGYYRCPIWQDLTDWLRENGVDVHKPVHYLRKEAISLVVRDNGIGAGALFAGHSDINITKQVYLGKKGVIRNQHIPAAFQEQYSRQQEEASA